MKFLCPSCKAKYQLADEKVAGRSVRMKCRKCGHMIHVSSADAIANSSAPPPADAPLTTESAVTGGAVAEPAKVEAPVAEKPAAPAKPETPAPSRVAAAPSGQTPEPAKVDAPKPETPPPPRARLGSRPDTAEKSRPQAPPEGTPAKEPLPAAGPSRTAVPRAPSATRPEVKKPASTPLKPALSGAAKATLQGTGPNMPTPAVAPAAAKAAPPAKPAAPAKPAKPAAKPLTAGVAARPLTGTGARAAVAASPALEDIPRFEDADDEEPTHIAEPGALASALAGAFTAAVRETTSHSVVTDPLNLPGDEWFVGINGVPVGPIRLAELRERASAGGVGRESLVWRDGFEEWRPLKNFPELVAIVEESLSNARASIVAASAAIKPMPDQLVSAPMASAPAASTAAGVTEDLELAGVPPRRGASSPAAWLAMVVAILFGVTLGFVLFGRTDQRADVQDKPQAPPVPSATAPAAKPEAQQAEEETVVTADPKAPGVKSTASTAKSAAKPEGDSKLSGGLKGLNGLSGLAPGATKGPGGESTGSNAGGQLDATALQSTVARYTPSVKRSCWQPALDTRDKDAPGSARVSVAITVGPSGSVQNVTPSGDPRGYRGLSNCIASRVRGWQFPPSSGTTTVNVPFVFVAQ